MKQINENLNTYKPKTMGVIGFGRFGQLWARMMREYFTVVVYDKKINPATLKKIQVSKGTWQQVCTQDIVVLAVPISQLEAVIKKIAPMLQSGQTVMDVASVKVLTKTLFSRYVSDEVEQILTHPMFGPDSAAESWQGLPIMMSPSGADGVVFRFWQELFWKLGLSVVVMTPQEHDRYAAYSQGVTHMVGRMLDDMKLQPTPIDTIGYKALLEVRKQTAQDTWQLFSDLQTYNPYTKKMRQALGTSFHKMYDKLLPKKPIRKQMLIGIQGGRGSFNEEACIQHCADEGISDYEIKYLYTSENVMKALEKGEIDYGQCAIQNGIGGMVRETVKAIAQHECQVAYEFEFIVNHCLMVKAGVKKSEIRIIMSHPQALSQCKSTLAKKYPSQHKKSETGRLIDQSLLAKHLGEGKLTRSIAVLAPRICAQLYNLKIVDEGLQDMKENFTTFMWFRR